MSAHLTEAQVRHVAKLGRLTLSDDEVRHFAVQLSKVLDYVDKLGRLDTEGVEPMAHAADLANVFREDLPAAGLSVEQALANAPESDPPFFKVPKVLGEGSGA